MRIYSKGDRVSQLQYGTGTVTDANERHTIIDFDEHGVRTFVTQMVKLESSDAPAPARATGRVRASRAKAKAVPKS